MTDFVERISYLAENPPARVRGCGDMGMGRARVLGRRYPLLIADRDTERLGRAVDTFLNEGYTAQRIDCDITSSEEVNNLAEILR